MQHAAAVTTCPPGLQHDVRGVWAVRRLESGEVAVQLRPRRHVAIKG